MDDCWVLWSVIAPGVAGAVFGAGWWFWVDAVVCSSASVPFLHYLPGIFATLAALMFNCIKKEDLPMTTHPTMESPSGVCRLKLWLFIVYVVSFVSLAASAGFLVQDSLTDKGPSSWTGVAGVLQCVLILLSGLVYWTCTSDDN